MEGYDAFLFGGKVMPMILIADSSKPSVVMTSEVFKDRIPGITIHVADSGKHALELLSDISPDLCVIDFDLPDADGPALIDSIRKQFDGPVLMTAFPDNFVEEAVKDNLFTWLDASNWLAKPINVTQLCQVIDKFLVERHRIGKRFTTEVEAQLVGKAAGRGKRAPKISGVVTNIGLGGVCVELDGSLKFKKNQEVMLSLALLEMEQDKPKAGRGAKKAGRRKTVARESSKGQGSETKLKAKIAWIAGGKVGLEFARLTDLQKKELLEFLRDCKPLDPSLF